MKNESRTKKVFFFLLLLLEQSKKTLYLQRYKVIYLPHDMKKQGFWRRVFDLYYDGFRHMTLGKTLWTVILIKLFIIFFVLKLFFFPNHIKENAEKGQEAEYVWQKMSEK